MAVLTIEELKSLFKTGGRPTGVDFESLIETLYASGVYTRETATVGLSDSVATVDGKSQWTLNGTPQGSSNLLILINGTETDSWTFCDGKVCFDYLLEDDYFLTAWY